MVQRAYKYRFYPTPTQEALLRQYFGSARWVWNQCLAWRTHLYRALDEAVTGVDFSRELTQLKRLEPYEWLRQVPATVLVQALRDQDKAFRNFFDGRARYPRFKSRQRRQSIRFQLDQRVVAGHYRAGEFLKLPGLGAVKLRWSRRPPGTPKMVTVSRDPAGRYFVSMAIEETIEALAPAPRGSVGIDLGTTDLATLSTGEKLENPRHLNRYLAQLERLQQRLSRQQKGSNRWHRTRQRIARLHARIADCRRDHLHRTSTRLIRENQVICLEDLNVDGMGRSARGTQDAPGKQVQQKAGLNRSIRDAAFGELIRQLGYKAVWYGRTVLQVDRFYPSSKTCSHCGHVRDELRLDQRTWTCPKCGSEHDRDINAARNIEAEGLGQWERTPGGAGDVRAFGGGPQRLPAACGMPSIPGGQGVRPVAVSARITQPSTACQEQEG